MKKIINKIKNKPIFPKYFINKVILLFLLLGMTGCGVPDLDKLDSVANDLGDITEGLEETVGNLTDAAGQIVGDKGTDALSKLTDDIINEKGENILQNEKKDIDKAEYISEEDFNYAYSKLSKSEKELYAEIYDILINLKDETPISSQNENELDKSFKAVLADHPEIFWVDGYNLTKYTLGDQITEISMCGQYNCSVDEKDAFQKDIEKKTNAILEDIDEDASDYSRVKAVYEYIIMNTNYDFDSKYNQDIRSVFLYGSSVCQGYAKATQYLLNKLGIPTTLVTGKALGEGHAWNLTKVDGEYYYLDTTWGDASYALEAGEEYDGRIPDVNYEYFLVTTDEILNTHKLGDKWDYPKCTSNISNYFIKEGLYFTSVDKEQLEVAFDKAQDKDMKYISLKCASKTCFDEMVEYLIDDQQVFEYLQGVDTLSFAISDDSLTIILWLR